MRRFEKTVGSEKYRETRYKVRIEAELLQGQKCVLKSHTVNISNRGAFLVTDEPPALRQLFRVRFVLPPHNTAIILPCMAAHAVHVGTPRRPAGIGIQLYGVGGVDGTRWQHFVRWIRTEHANSTSQTLSFYELEAPDNTKLDPAFDGRVKLRFRSVEELQRLYDTNLERGGILLPTRGDVAQGTPVELTLVHPKDNSQFPLRGIVCANIQRKDFSGVSVAIDDFDDVLLDALFNFVYSGLEITVDFTGSLGARPESEATDPHNWAAGLA
jgi:hypothetical protein